MEGPRKSDNGKRLKNTDLQKCCTYTPGEVYKNALICILHYSLKLGYKYPPTVEWINCNMPKLGILYSNEKEQMSATHNNMGNFYNIEQKKQDTKDYIR